MKQLLRNTRFFELEYFNKHSNGIGSYQQSVDKSVNSDLLHFLTNSFVFRFYCPCTYNIFVILHGKGNSMPDSSSSPPWMVSPHRWKAHPRPCSMEGLGKPMNFKQDTTFSVHFGDTRRNHGPGPRKTGHPQAAGRLSKRTAPREKRKMRPEGIRPGVGEIRFTNPSRPSIMARS